ncbi:MAG: GntR family transcriptional regulator [Candidatus Neomarinimicrobiota bacterium]|nr:GntR family transcriptional regulator [Candidatus Neomarinimicrobiota bacterium]RKY48935.1 MAG: GntR family transcriptional regulator [Candidatus Neomarinimicrobiota bacterium]RKY52934.1 MAG: GntR family transcriptional regulator [Candidatus Neomarinimicrobiota bacterium]
MEFREDKAIYLQIADCILDNILSKSWRTGDRIPSVREMAISIEVNPNTVMRTYTYLQDKGIIFNKRGIGYFVSENAYELAKNIKKEEFIKKQMPVFFRNMEMLNISFSELRKLYEEFKNKDAGEENENYQ